MARNLHILSACLVAITLAEVTTSFHDPSLGMIFHSAILVSLLACWALKHEANPASNFFLGLSLAPLIRILSFSLPIIYFPRYAWYLVASVPVLAATLTLMRVEGIGFGDVGIAFRKPIAQTGIALTGIPFAVIEYSILKPEPLAVGLSFTDFILLAIALIFSTGLAEEMVFRGVMQQTAIETLGKKAGITGVAAVFAALHIGWLSMPDMLFVFCIGLFFGYSTLKTGSIIGVSLSHGITNVFLFLVIPHTKLISAL